MNITIQNPSGTSLGPYDIYYDVVAAPYLLTASITSASLAAGLNLSIPNTATTLYVVNTRVGCGSVAQSIPVPPSTVPLTYNDVQVQARFGSNTTAPNTASVYYQIDNQGWNYLGNIWDDTCQLMPLIPVPTNSRIILGIISGSQQLSFSATGSTYLCSNSGLPTTYCGITIPYFEPIYGTAQISLQAKTNAALGVTTLQTCGNIIPPPGPTPPPILPASIAYGPLSSTNNARLIQLTIERTRVGTPDTMILNTNAQAPIPSGLFSGATSPSIQPGDVLTIKISSQERPPSGLWGVVMELEQTSGASNILLYQTAGYTTQDTYVLTVQSGADYTLTIRDF